MGLTIAEVCGVMPVRNNAGEIATHRWDQPLRQCAGKCRWEILPVESLPTGGIDHCGSVRNNADTEHCLWHRYPQMGSTIAAVCGVMPVLDKKPMKSIPTDGIDPCGSVRDNAGAG